MDIRLLTFRIVRSIDRKSIDSRQEQGGGGTEASTVAPGEAWGQATEPDGLLAPLPHRTRVRLEISTGTPWRGKSFKRRLNLKHLSAACIL